MMACGSQPASARKQRMPRDAGAPANRTWPGLPAENPKVTVCELLAHPRTDHNADTCARRSPPPVPMDIRRLPKTRALPHNSPPLGRTMDSAGCVNTPHSCAPSEPKDINSNTEVDAHPDPRAVLKRLLERSHKQIRQHAPWAIHNQCLHHSLVALRNFRRSSGPQRLNRENPQYNKPPNKDSLHFELPALPNLCPVGVTMC